MSLLSKLRADVFHLRKLIAEKIEALTKQLKNELDSIGKEAGRVDSGLAGIESELASINTDKKQRMKGGRKKKTKRRSKRNRKTKKGGYIWKFNKNSNIATS